MKSSKETDGECALSLTSTHSRTRFNDEQELALLRSVARHYPNQASFGSVAKTWGAISAIMSATIQVKFTSRTCLEIRQKHQ